MNFGVAVAGVAGALTGLLFVAVSVRTSAVSASRCLSSRAAETLVLVMTSVMVALVLVAPQPSVAVGLELLGWALLSGALKVILDRRAGNQSTYRAARYIERFPSNTITSVLLFDIAVAGMLTM